MPRRTLQEIEQHIAAGEIVGFTLDTTEFYHLGHNFDAKSLQALGQFAGSKVSVVFSEVVLREVERHVGDDIKAKSDLTRSGVRQLIKAAKLSVEPERLMVDAGLLVNPADRAKELLENFISKVSATSIPAETGVSVKRLHDMYFQNQPPFSGKADKKHEFPDAIALLALENWAISNNGLLLAISGDGDWARFAEKSSSVICLPQLSPALSLFNKEDSIFAARLAATLQGSGGDELRNRIDYELENSLEDFEVEANAPYHYEIGDQYASLISWQLSGSDFDVVASDDDTVTVAFNIDVEAKFHASFSFTVRDGIDKDYITIGGAETEKSERFSVEVIATMARNDFDSDPEIIELETDFSAPTVDFDYVEIDYGDPYEEQDRD